MTRSVSGAWDTPSSPSGVKTKAWLIARRTADTTRWYSCAAKASNAAARAAGDTGPSPLLVQATTSPLPGPSARALSATPRSTATGPRSKQYRSTSGAVPKHPAAAAHISVSRGPAPASG